jgi:hypothetical protein
MRSNPFSYIFMMETSSCMHSLIFLILQRHLIVVIHPERNQIAKLMYRIVLPDFRWLFS